MTLDEHIAGLVRDAVAPVVSELRNVREELKIVRAALPLLGMPLHAGAELEMIGRSRAGSTLRDTAETGSRVTQVHSADRFSPTPCGIAISRARQAGPKGRRECWIARG